MPQTNQQQTHGKPHQINIYVVDRESSITSKGLHKRCIVFKAGNAIEVRVDNVAGDEDLPWPTLDQVKAMANHPDHRMHGRGVKLQHLETHEPEHQSTTPGFLGSRWYIFGMTH